MKFLTPYKVAAYLLGLFFMGHTVGGMIVQPSRGAASDAVLESMKQVHFDFRGADATWYGFWLGFGLLASVFLLLSVIMAWHLDNVPAPSWPAVSTIAWALAASHVATAILSWKFFFAGPGTIGTLAAASLIVGALRKQRAGAGP